MKSQIGSTKQVWPEGAAEPPSMSGEKSVIEIKEPCRDIVEAARSLGFSRKELLEIKRVYQTNLKTRRK